jgi:hypothetical protein
MGGILQVLEVPGFLENDNELMDTATSETSLMTELIEKWHELHGETELVPNDLFMIASAPDDPEDRKNSDPSIAGYNLLAELLGGGREHARRVALGRILEHSKSRVISGYKIMRITTDKKRPRYKLVKAPNAGVAATPAGLPREENHENSAV